MRRASFSFHLPNPLTRLWSAIGCRRKHLCNVLRNGFETVCSLLCHCNKTSCDEICIRTICEDDCMCLPGFQKEGTLLTSYNMTTATTTYATTTQQPCEYPKIFTSCLILRTCDTLASRNSTVEDRSNCEEGCMCPEDLVQEKGECIKPTECPCFYKGKFYRRNETFVIETRNDCDLIQATCTAEGIIKWVNENCTSSCPEPFIWKKCACNRTCTFHNHSCNVENCSPGCACPDGTHYQDGNCVKTCQCLVDGKPVNDTVKTSACNLCKCVDDVLKCGEICDITCPKNWILVNEDLNDGVCCRCEPVNRCEYPKNSGEFHEVGEVWNDGPCKTIECLPGRSLSIIEITCEALSCDNSTWITDTGRFPCVVKDGLNDINIIPDSYISTSPETPNSPASAIRPESSGWRVPVPKSPSQPKPSVTIKLTDNPEGVELVRVISWGAFGKMTVLLQSPGSEEFHETAGGSNITQTLTLNNYPKTTAIKVILESPGVVEGSIPDDYILWLQIQACFTPVPCVEKDGLNDINIIPDSYISTSPETPNSPASAIRPESSGWRVPVPKSPSQPKPSVTIKLTDNPEGVELVRVISWGAFGKMTVLLQSPGSEEFHETAGGSNITQTLTLNNYPKTTAIKVILESPGVVEGSIPDDYILWLQIQACFTPKQVTTTTTPVTTSSVTTPHPTTTTPIVSTTTRTTSPVPCVVKDGLNDINIIPDSYISTSPETPNSPASAIRPESSGWRVPVPKSPSQPKPSVTIKLTDNPEGVELVRVISWGAFGKMTVLLQSPGSEEFHETAGGSNITQTLTLNNYPKTTAIKVILESPGVVEGSIPDDYILWLQIQACFTPKQVTTTTTPVTTSVTTPHPTTTTPIVSTTTRTTSPVPCVVKDGLNDINIIPDSYISTSPETPNSPASAIRPESSGWRVPVPKSPSQPKPSVTIKLTDNPEGVELVRVISWGDFGKMTVLLQSPGSEEFHETAGGSNITQTLTLNNYPKTTAIKVILESPGVVEGSIPDDYILWLQIQACFTPKQVTTTTTPVTTSVTTPHPTTTTPIVSTTTRTTSPVPCVVKDGLNDINIIPDSYISTSPETPNSPASAIRPESSGWRVPVPKSPSQPKPSVTIKLTDNPEGVELVRVISWGAFGKMTVLLQSPGSEEFHETAGGSNITQTLTLNNYPKTTAIKVILESPGVVEGSIPDDYILWLQIQACFTPKQAPCDVTDGLNDMSVIPDSFISATPDTPDSPVSSIRVESSGWRVPVPKSPSQPKPTITIKLTDDPKGVQLLEVAFMGTVGTASYLVQIPGSKKFHNINGGS
ncbi:hypothetical protein Ahia01_000590900, partial [Argonauta hians]